MPEKLDGHTIIPIILSEDEYGMGSSMDLILSQKHGQQSR